MNSEFEPCITSSPSKSLLVIYGENNLDISLSKAVLTTTQNKEVESGEEVDESKWKNVEKRRGGCGIRHAAISSKRAGIINQSNELRLIETSNFSDFKVTRSNSIFEAIDHHYYFDQEENEVVELDLEQFSFVNATCVFEATAATATAKSENLKSNNMQRMHFEAGNYYYFFFDLKLNHSTLSFIPKSRE
jgi:hypothetical protein